MILPREAVTRVGNILLKICLYWGKKRDGGIDSECRGKETERFRRC